jgi:hypothetical protein
MGARRTPLSATDADEGRRVAESLGEAAARRLLDLPDLRPVLMAFDSHAGHRLPPAVRQALWRRIEDPRPVTRGELAHWWDVFARHQEG